MKTVDIDPQEFTKLYDEGVSYRELAKKYDCGTTKIQAMRVALKLHVRGNMSRATSYHPKNVDEKRFRELYEAGLSYLEIGDKLGINTVGTVARYVRVFGLPERDRTLARIDTEKFKKMYLDGCSMRGLVREFQINQITTKRIIKILDLPERTDRTKPGVAPKLHVIEFEEPDDSLDDSLDDNPDDNPDDEINDVLDDEINVNPDEQVQHNPKKYFNVPTLRELEKKQQAYDMIRAETEYRNKWRKE